VVDGAGPDLHQDLSRLQNRIRHISVLHDIQFTVLKKVESFQSSTVLFDRLVLYD
jgi:hypothetical protein